MMPNLQVSPEPTAVPADADGFRNREDWLNRGALLLLDHMARFGFQSDTRPYISVGFPKGSRGAIGQAWTGERSADGHGHIFISPEIESGAEALAVLLHELVHDVTGEYNHRKVFSQAAKAVGLEKPWTATVPGAMLSTAIAAMLEKLGEYPHARLDGSRVKRAPKPSRAVKLVCTGCGRKITAYGSDPLEAVHTGCGDFIPAPEKGEAGEE